jgi:hypothetical protein
MHLRSERKGAGELRAKEARARAVTGHVTTGGSEVACCRRRRGGYSYGLADGCLRAIGQSRQTPCTTRWDPELHRYSAMSGSVVSNGTSGIAGGVNCALSVSLSLSIWRGVIVLSTGRGELRCNTLATSLRSTTTAARVPANETAAGQAGGSPG